MRSLFILPGLDASVGRNFTHIDLWRKCNGQTTVAAFTRDGDSKRERKVDVVLGHLQHGKLFARIPIYKNALERLMGLVSNVDVVFVYTLDNFLFAWMAKVAAKSDVRIILFVMDIRKMFVGDSLFNQITQSFLLFAFERCDMILVTSRHYIEDYSVNYLKRVPGRWCEIENKVDAQEILIGKDVSVQRDNPEQIVIGYFGVIRCAHSLRVLNQLVEKAQGRFKVVIRGIFLDVDDMLDSVERSPWMDYQGPYHNPDDLYVVYNACDIVWACYPFSNATEGNHRWAKTNRFYEAGYFKKPIIAGVDTKDGIYVQRHDIGLTIDLASVDIAVDNMMAVNHQRIDDWQKALLALPATEFIYTDEFSRLFVEIQEFCGQSAKSGAR